MEAIEKNNASNTHQEKAKKLRKLRRWKSQSACWEQQSLFGE